MKKQEKLDIQPGQKEKRVEEFKFEPIKGHPYLHWQGKRPFKSTQYFPAQLKESYGKSVDGWMNEIYWGDNLQVMSHLLKTYRGKVDLIYIDPPFDSKADYKKQISLKGKKISNDLNTFEDKQYTDIWSNDEFLQFNYERLILIRELLSPRGSIFLHCDHNKSHLFRFICEEIFGSNNFVNEIIWRRKQATSFASKQFGIVNDTIFWFSKTSDYVFNPTYSKEDANTKKYIKERFIFDDGDGKKYMKSPLINSLYRPNLKYEFHGVNPPPNGWLYSKERMQNMYDKNALVMPVNNNGRIYRKIFLDEYKGQLLQNLWLDIPIVNPMAKERVNYPTQKPEQLIQRIITTSSKPGDIIFDCFMGSGTTQAVATKLGRRFIGADINLGAIQTTTDRLIKVVKEISGNGQTEIMTDNKDGIESYYTGFNVYNVNNYDFFRNPIEARELLIEALEIQPILRNNIYDGEKDGRMVKIMPVNRIATKADLNELITGFDYKAFERKKDENSNNPVERLLLVCMGHEPNLAASLQKEVNYNLDIEVVDILRDRAELEFKRESEANVIIENGHLVIKAFYPMNLLQKLSIMKENVGDWKELVDSIMIDWDYDGAILKPDILDLPEKNEMVKGKYKMPDINRTIMVKITDLLSESIEVEVENA